MCEQKRFSAQCSRTSPAVFDRRIFVICLGPQKNPQVIVPVSLSPRSDMTKFLKRKLPMPFCSLASVAGSYAMRIVAPREGCMDGGSATERCDRGVGAKRGENGMCNDGSGKKSRGHGIHVKAHDSGEMHH